MQDEKQSKIVLSESPECLNLASHLEQLMLPLGHDSFHVLSGRDIKADPFLKDPLKDILFNQIACIGSHRTS